MAVRPRTFVNMTGSRRIPHLTDAKRPSCAAGRMKRNMISKKRKKNILGWGLERASQTDRIDEFGFSEQAH